jgi:hypothetical protein
MLELRFKGYLILDKRGMKTFQGEQIAKAQAQRQRIA